MIDSTLIVASFLLGGILGTRAIIAGLAGLVAILAVTSSLPFQVGLPNLALVPAYLLGLVGAGFWARHRDRRARPQRPGAADVPARLRTWTALTVLTILVASFLAILRRYSTSAHPSFDVDPRDFFVLGPPGLSGEIQTAYVALIGPLLFVLAVGALREKTGQLLLRRAFTAGVFLAVIAPAVQFLALTPWVRPDQRTYEGSGITGLVGFFQDPHSYAAFLVFAVAFCSGMAIGCARRGNKATLIGYALLGAAAALMLQYTNSRAGLFSMLAALVALSLLTVSSPSMSDRARRWRKGLIVALLLSAIGATTVLASTTGSLTAYGQLAKLGNPRMWEFVRSGPVALLEGRVVRLKKALVILQTNPIWGVGPNRFQITEVNVPGADPVVLASHPHNYFAQLATEYGLVAAGSFLVLVGAILTLTIGGAYRATRPMDRALLAGIAAGQIGVLTISLVSHPLLLPELQAAFWTMSALGVAMALDVPSAQSRSSKSRPTSTPKNGIGAGNAGALPPE